MRESWTDLIYNGENFGDILKISNKGRIKNIKTGIFPPSKREHRMMTARIYYKGATHRINIGKAQEQSGLEITVFDLPDRKMIEFTKRQEEILDKVYGKRLEEQQVEIDKLKKQVSQLITKYK